MAGGKTQGDQCAEAGSMSCLEPDAEQRRFCIRLDVRNPTLKCMLQSKIGKNGKLVWTLHGKGGDMRRYQERMRWQWKDRRSSVSSSKHFRKRRSLSLTW